MSDQKITLLHSGGKFLFSSQKDFSTIPNIQRLRTANGDLLWGFEDLYPQAAVTFTYLKALGPVTATGPAAALAKRIVSVPQAITDASVIDNNSDLFKFSPYSHQVDAILKMLHYDRLALLFEQGLGKTYITLMYLALKRRLDERDYKMLVVAPKIVGPNWLREARKYTGLRGELLLGSQVHRDKVKESLSRLEWDFIITTYDVLGNAKSNQKNGRATKEAKIDYWTDMPAGRRSMFTQSFVRKNLLEPEQAAYLLKAKPESEKERKELWQTLSKVAKTLNSTEAVKYQNVYSDLEFLKTMPYDILVLDEASRIKNHKSARTQAVEALADKARYRYHLSGTLCNGNPVDMYAPFRLLNTKLWTGFAEFENKYIRYSPYNKHVITGYKNFDDLKLRIDPYKFEMKRQECLSQPERVIQDVDVTLDEHLQALYNSIAHKETTSVTVNGLVINTATSAVKISKLSQLMSGFLYPTMTIDHFKWCDSCKNILECLSADRYPWHDKCLRKEEHGMTSAPKLEPIVFGNSKLLALEEDLEDSHEKTIIWCWYQTDKDRIRNLLEKKKIKYITADAKNCDAIFESDPSIRVFLGQTSQGIGITLNTATRMIYYSHGMVLEAWLQSIDRNYRIGQEQKVLVRNYVDSGAVEATILRLLEHKVDVKTFLQNSIECFTCEHQLKCVGNNIEVYSEGCIHFDKRATAEEKVSIAIQPYKVLGVTGRESTWRDYESDEDFDLPNSFTIRTVE